MNNIYIKYSAVTLLLVIFFIDPPKYGNTFQDTLNKQIDINATQFLTEGEELTYEVSWWFIKIGTIRTKVIEIKKHIEKIDERIPDYSFDTNGVVHKIEELGCYD